MPFVAKTSKLCFTYCVTVQIRHASRITKYKRPFVGGIYKKIQLPYSPSIESEYAEHSLRPSIPSQFPDGIWGKMSREQAWKFHERKTELLKKQSVRARLQEITGLETKEKMKRWKIEADGELPFGFPFLQFITKTELHRDVPSEYLVSPKCDLENLERKIVDKLSLIEAKGGDVKERVGSLVEVVKESIVSSTDLGHLVDGQFDRETVFEAGWRRFGFEMDDIEDHGPKTKNWFRSWGKYLPVGEYKHEDPGIINFQARSSPFLAYRTKHPIIPDAGDLSGKEEIGSDPFVHSWVSYDSNSIPLYAYHPSAFGLTSEVVPPTINPGFKLQPIKSFDWVHRPSQRARNWRRLSEYGKVSYAYEEFNPETHAGVEQEPCQFPHTAFLTPTSLDGLEARCFSEDSFQVLQWDAERALTCLFAWNVAAAHIQGFNAYLDLTYPLRSHAVLTDGQSWQFFVHQTNTLELWRDDDAFTVKNPLWMTRKLDFAENRHLVLTLLSNFLAKETGREMTEEELKPYVTDHEVIDEIVKPKYDFEMKVI